MSDNGIFTDSFSFTSEVTDTLNAEKTIFLGTYVTPDGGGGNIQLEIYFHSNGFTQTTAATAANKCSPSKLTVMLEVLNGDWSRTNGNVGINITGYAIQYGYFDFDTNTITAEQQTGYNGLWKYQIYMKMKAYGYPVVHATMSNGIWYPSMSTVTFSNWGDTYAPKTIARGYKIPILYKFLGGMIETPNGFNVSSSRRYKKNITDLPENYNLDMIMKMKPIIYQKQDEPGNLTIYPGLIAEDLHDLSANIFVSYNNNNKPESLDYSRINVLLVKAAQQLNEKVDQLAEDLKRLLDE